MHPKPRIAAMTCTTCTDADFVAVETKPAGLASRLLSVFSGFRPIARLEVERLSAHQLRDLGLADGRAAPSRDRMRD
jgi:hypothetical protein